MKSRLFLTFILLLQIIFSVSADEQKIINNTTVTGVKIFLAGAQVNRTFRTSLETGTTTIAVTDLSSQIDANSISATVSGDAMIMSTSFMMDYLKETKISPQTKLLKDSLEKLNEKQAELSMMKSVYNEEIAMLSANRSVGGSNVGVNSENLQKVADFFRTRMIELKTKMMDIDKKTVKLTESINRLNQQLNEEYSRMNRPYGTILITVSAAQNTSAGFELTYYARGAWWKPVYDIRSKDVKSSVTLLYKASVSQMTGEDWKNVHVSLSSGNPTLGNNRPVLQPWFLQLQQPVVYRNEGKSKKMSGYGEGVGAAPQSIEEVVVRGSRDDEANYSVDGMSDSVTMTENQVVTEFDIQIPYTVMSDGKAVMMDIQSFNLPATYSYYATPKIDNDAFLVASITGWEQLNLLPGLANVYLENSYVGDSYVDPSLATDTLLLSFGRDKRIMIKREKVKDMNSTKFVGGSVEKEFLFETTIRNTKKDSINITIEDQIPLTTNEDLKIANGELSGGNLNGQTGMINWKFTLKPGESKKVRLGYKVRYPKDRIVPGL